VWLVLLKNLKVFIANILVVWDVTLCSG